MEVLIVDYGVGNVAAIANILKHVGAKPTISSDPALIARAPKLILPGVGAFDNGVIKLRERGLIEPLNRRVLGDKVPILGICVGMQLFAKRSEEGELPGLGWLDADVVKFKFQPGSEQRVPHMGWNEVQEKRPGVLLADPPEGLRFYFAHSYYLECRDPSDVYATTHYGYEFASMIQRGNIYGAQCHPEKSHKFGMKLLKNFAERAV